MSKLITFLKRLYTSLFSQNQFKIQTFTYFIPAPKPRNTGYREKHFDRIFYEFINKGYKVIDFKTQQCTTGQETSGIWLIFLVQAKNAQAEQLNLDEIDIQSFTNEESQVTSHTDEQVMMTNDGQEGETFIELPETPEEFTDEVQGLYQIKEK